MARADRPSEQRVSVLIPAFNHEQYIEQAIRSVWTQTRKAFELIVIDDGSADRTAKIAEALRVISPVPMRVVARQNRGVSATLNEAIQLARGEWIAFLASDDYYHPDFISANLAAIGKYASGLVALHSDAYMVDERGTVSTRTSQLSDRTPVDDDAFSMLIARTGFVIAPTVFTSKNAIAMAGMFDETMVAEDFDFHLRLSRIAKFRYLDKPLYYSRTVPGSLGRRPWLWGPDILRAIEKHGDLLGRRLPSVLRDRCQIISDTCFLHGGVLPGISWGARAYGLADSAPAKLAVTLHTTRSAILLTARHWITRIAPNELVRQLRLAKRAIRSRSRGRHDS